MRDRGAFIVPDAAAVGTVAELRAFLALLPDDMPVDTGMGRAKIRAEVMRFYRAGPDDTYVDDGCGLRFRLAENDGGDEGDDDE